MFDLLFGWRKASKCKRLIRKVQCRLKLLKNKRSCIAKQLRGDVAQLLKHGHDHTAFDRAEQIIKDESMVELYDLIENYCEFVIINLPYMRKHKDCPDDINEAISTLVFCSARFGELPELLLLRKLFGERYGKKFVAASLELLPGNLVNLQIQETLYMKDVPDELKYKLLDEIASTSVEPGPLLLEYEPCSQQQILSEDVPENDQNSVVEMPVHESTEAEGKIVNVEPCNDVGQKLGKPLESGEVFKFPILGDEPLLIRDSGGATVTEDSASENLFQLPKEMIYLDDVQEFVFPVGKDGNLQDQRLFVFKSFGKYSILEEQMLSQNGKSPSRSSKRTRSASKKRLRRRSLSNRDNVTDVQCAIYYGELVEVSPDKKSEGKNQRQRTKSLVEESRYSKRDVVNTHNLEHAKDLDVRSLEKGTNNSDLQLVPYCDGDERLNSKTGEVDSATPISRALTMPPERPNETPIDNIVRWMSLPPQRPHDQSASCQHIHPKLPDYDELAEKFLALKRANLENNQQFTDKRV